MNIPRTKFNEIFVPGRRKLSPSKNWEMKNWAYKIRNKLHCSLRLHQEVMLCVVFICLGVYKYPQNNEQIFINFFFTCVASGQRWKCLNFVKDPDGILNTKALPHPPTPPTLPLVEVCAATVFSVVLQLLP